MQTLKMRDGASIAYSIDDFTPPWKASESILLLHAAMGKSQRYFSWMSALAQRYRVIRFDLRGHGDSAPVDPDSPLTLDMLVSDAIEVLNATDASSVHVVGNSAGGYVAQQLAMNHPERVRTLSLFGSTPGLKNSHALSWLPKIKEMGLREFLAATISERFDADADPELVKWFLDQTGSNDPVYVERFIREMCKHDWTEDLGRITCPTLIVAAGGEQIGSATAYSRMKDKIRDCELVLYDTAGHAICDAYPQRCVQDLLSFLEHHH